MIRSKTDVSDGNTMTRHPCVSVTIVCTNNNQQLNSQSNYSRGRGFQVLRTCKDHEGDDRPGDLLVLLPWLAAKLTASKPNNDSVRLDYRKIFSSEGEGFTVGTHTHTQVKH